MISLTARGLSTGEIFAHWAEVYGASVSKDTITDTVIEEVAEGYNGPLGPGLPGAAHRRFLYLIRSRLD